MPIQIQPLDLASVYGNVTAIQNAQQQNRLMGMQMQQAEQQMADRERLNPLLGSLDLTGGMAGNQETLQGITRIDPQMGLQLQQSFMQMDSQQQEDARTKLAIGQRFLAGILSLSAEQQPAAYAAGLQQMEQMGVTGLPDQFDPSAAQAAYTNLADLDALFAPPPTRTIQDGRTNLTQEWDPTTRTYNTVATGAMDAPKEPETPTPYTDAGRALVDYQNGFISLEQLQAVGQESPDVSELVGRANTLRDDWSRDSSEFLLTRSQYARLATIKDGYESNVPGDIAASDLALTFILMKMYDPGGRVTEGEQATVANAGSVPQRIRTAYNNALQGQAMDTDLRNAFLRQVEGIWAETTSMQQQLNDSYAAMAERAGVNKDDVITVPLDAPTQAGGAVGNVPQGVPEGSTRVGTLDGKEAWSDQNGQIWIVE